MLKIYPKDTKIKIQEIDYPFNEMHISKLIYNGNIKELTIKLY